MLIIIASANLLAACGNDGGNGSRNPDAGFVDYVEAYTGGLVTGTSTIKVRFASAPDTSVPPEGLFTFSPSLKGNARWAGGRMLEFIPEDGQLKQGKEYRGKLNLEKIFGIAEPSLKTFSFSFTVAPKRAAIVIDNVKISGNTRNSAAVNGRVLLSEPVTTETLTSMIYTEGNDAGAKISVTPTPNQDIFEFSCAPVARTDSDSRFTVVFDGHEADFGKTVAAEVTVPGTEGFRVLSAKNFDGAEPYVEVVLSQPLDPLADCTGLFTLSGDGRSYSSCDGNIVRVFYGSGGVPADFTLTVSSALKDCNGNRLGEDWTADFRSEEIKPAVRLPFQGNMLPDDGNLLLPFQAVNLKAVDVKVVKIYRDNVLTFLQGNGLDGGYELRRSGRLVYGRTLALDTNPQTDLHRWQNFSVDLSGIMKREKGAIYRVTFSFKQDYSVYGQDLVSSYNSDGEKLTRLSEGDMTEAEEAVWDIPEAYYYDNCFDWEKYDWTQRDNPLNPSYYMDDSRFPSVNLLSSNVGIIAKSGVEGKLMVYVNDVLTSRPVAGAEVSAYSYQLRTLASARTDADGFAELSFEGKAFAVTAKSGDTVSYLKVTDGQENPLNKFDVGGEKVEKGLRGFVYGERGVWRPGDTMHLVLLIDSEGNVPPSNHPAVLEVYNPMGQFFSRQICPKSVNGFYTFEVKTSESDPTGTYHAYAKIGGASFHKALPVESIKPNRLKIDLKLPSEVLQAGTDTVFRLSSSWLTGSAASSLRAKSSVKFRQCSSSFSGFGGYLFSNPLSEFKSTDSELFDIRLDPHGKASPRVHLPSVDDAPGMLNATLVTRVCEPGGDESIVSQTVKYSPFNAYAGVKLPDSPEDFLVTDREHTFRVCTVDGNGGRVPGHRLEYFIYRLDWSWWWEKGGESLASYVKSSSAKLYASGQLVSGQKDSEIKFRLDYPDWGRFLFYVKDLDSGHSSGAVFLCDWPSWRGRADRGEGAAAAMLNFSLDRKSYDVGDEGTIYLPAAKDARALVTFENDSRVLSSTWVETKAGGETAFRFRVTEEMAPNCYACVTLLNPHSRSSEGQPVRMYGVQPVVVSRPGSRLEPVISLPQVIRPQEEFTLKVSEKSGKPMTYTVAAVDEGLLDLTSFRTPDPWAEMHRRAALGVRTWDLYDSVIGLFGSSFSSMFSIGGDEDVLSGGSVRDNRFTPVVYFSGPFTLGRGEAEHKITLPMYVGAVRVMVVAAQDGSYGSADKTVPVRSPLMILPTLPRALGAGERLTMPVNVFAMEDGIRDVEISVLTSGALRLSGDGIKSLNFNSSGDRLTSFDLVAGTSPGPASVKVTAKSGSFRAEETVNIEVRNPNPSVLSVKRAVLRPGEECRFDCPSAGVEGNFLEVSSFPSIDINGVWSYMKYYPHQCTEQLCAGGISLLSILPLLDGERRNGANELIENSLHKLYPRQLTDGNFVYWPGGAQINLWADAMAGHFLALASGAGFSINGGAFGAWRNKVQKYVNSYRPDGSVYDELAVYDLYVLALSGNAQEGAMNRFRESGALSRNARLMLASSYALAGRVSVARSIIDDLKTVKTGKSPAETSNKSDLFFGSQLRDDAVALEAYVSVSDLASAMKLASKVAEGFSCEGYTTQTAAFAASALSKLLPLTDNSAMSFKYECSFGKSGANSENVKTANSLWTRTISSDATSVKLTNSSRGILYAGFTSRTTAGSGERLKAYSSGIGVSVAYRDLDGNAINPSSLPQGTDFTADVTVSDISGGTGYRNLALTVGIPSGWEIFNSRLFGGEDNAAASYSGCDVRDSGVVYYFDLPKASSKTFSIRLSAAYPGVFVLPSVSCEAMYDNSVAARTASSTVRVISPAPAAK